MVFAYQIVLTSQKSHPGLSFMHGLGEQQPIFQEKTKQNGFFFNLPHCKEYEASTGGGFSAPGAAHAALLVDGVIMPGRLQTSHLFCYTK